MLSNHDFNELQRLRLKHWRLEYGPDGPWGKIRELERRIEILETRLIDSKTE